MLLTDRKTDKQTNKQTNTTENITSLLIMKKSSSSTVQLVEYPINFSLLLFIIYYY